MRIQNSQLVAAKVSKLEFRGKEGKFPRHFNGLSNWECTSSINSPNSPLGRRQIGIAEPCRSGLAVQTHEFLRHANKGGPLPLLAHS
jgi:hypothetical protein